MSNTNDRILIHKDGEEGSIQIDRLEGKVMTPADERPEWADGIAVALLTERVGYYETRLGTQLSQELRSPEVIVFQDLGWIGVDAEGDEVELEADGEFRMNILADMLGVDREDFTDTKNFQGALASIELDQTYKTQPTGEATLAEAEGITFGEVEKKAVNG